MELATTIIGILSPALSSLASWLVGLLMKKFGSSAALQAAHLGLRDFKAERVAAKRQSNQRGCAASSLVLVMALCAALVLFLFGYSASADPVRNTVGQTTVAQVTIASGQTTSGAIDLGAFTLAGVLTPSSLTGTTLTFLTSNSINGPWVQVYNSAGAVSYAVAPSRYVAINMADFQGVRFLEVVSGSAEAAARTLNLSIKTSY